MFMPVTIINALYICLYMGSVYGTDMGGRCLMRAQNECITKSTAIFIAKYNRKYADVCKSVEEYKSCIQRSVNSKLKCSLTENERNLHSKNIYGYQDAPYNCHITGSDFAAQNFIIRNAASIVNYQNNLQKCLLKVTLINIICFLLNSILGYC